MEKSIIKKVAYALFWVLVAIAAGLLFAAGFQGCYAGEDQHNWIEIEDAGAEAELGDAVQLEKTESRIITPPMIPTCDRLAMSLADNQCDFCPLMESMCPDWLGNHTGADGQIRIGNTIIAEYNCYDYEDNC